MPVITVERAEGAKTVISRMVEQGVALFDDIAETAQALARLSEQIDERNQQIEQRDHLIVALRDEIARLDSQLADANARLDSISQTARGESPPDVPHTNGGGRDAARKAGIAALERLARTGAVS